MENTKKKQHNDNAAAMISDGWVLLFKKHKDLLVHCIQTLASCLPFAQVLADSIITTLSLLTNPLAFAYFLLT